MISMSAIIYYFFRKQEQYTCSIQRFVPKELIDIGKKNNLKLKKINGLNFNPFMDKWNISNDTSINYIANFEKN